MLAICFKPKNCLRSKQNSSELIRGRHYLLKESLFTGKKILPGAIIYNKYYVGSTFSL